MFFLPSSLFKKPKRRPQARRFLSLHHKHYLAHKEQARVLIETKVDYFAPLVGVNPGRIFVKKQKTRWGSCSTKGNLNFNYRLLHIEEELADYVIVHELCHLKHFNHSRDFWLEVAKVVPNYANIRKKLKETRF